MRRKLERRFEEVIPRESLSHRQERNAEAGIAMARTIFYPSQKDIAAVLDPLENSGCNAHLVGMILDAAVAAVVPDLVAASITESSYKHKATETEGISEPGPEVDEPNVDTG